MHEEYTFGCLQSKVFVVILALQLVFTCSCDRSDCSAHSGPSAARQIQSSGCYTFVDEVGTTPHWSNNQSASLDTELLLRVDVSHCTAVLCTVV